MPCIWWSGESIGARRRFIDQRFVSFAIASKASSVGGSDAHFPGPEKQSGQGSATHDHATSLKESRIAKNRFFQERGICGRRLGEDRENRHGRVSVASVRCHRVSAPLPAK